MKLTLVRKIFTDKSTIGHLLIDGVFECFTLEDMVRDHKIAGITAIPEGTYQVLITMSTRFRRYLPLIVNVPNFGGIRIHAGNSPSDTDGCILVGHSHRADWTDWIGESKVAFDALFPKIKGNLDSGGKVEIEVTGNSRGAAAPPFNDLKTYLPKQGH